MINDLNSCLIVVVDALNPYTFKSDIDNRDCLHAFVNEKHNAHHCMAFTTVYMTCACVCVR